ncbi:ABC transporter permease [Actinoplanes derwentensis]|uniref:Peptide/nickel transport system permease protein n=1 Tax=Actinoplanes derwentensis TaxID=113562 RepID=A0A1H2CXH0_9ACTN|nr:ABC transporter permease [Actinoplanes derwentensis]GID82842.1 ABC transporter permease [Actinoplanes derwentensis]SDT75195.1 peptide/nickel transport system permease protein [Actinoplanes derwentensis]
MSTKIDKIDRLGELSAAKQDEHGVSLWTEAFRRVRRSPSALVGVGILVVFVVVAIVGPWLVPYSPSEMMGLNQVRPGSIPGPSAEHWLGYDHNGRDQFSRLVVGARQTLLVGIISTLIGLTVGALIGGIAGASAGLGGRIGRAVDSVLMRIVDMLLALPSLLLAVSIAALLGAGLTTVMIAVGVVSVPIFARLLRSAMVAQAGSDYVLAATSLGVKRTKIAIAHILPNSLAPVIVQATLTLATAIIEAAALSFLGLGNPDSSTPEWGMMLSEAQQYLDVRPGLAIFPALGIIITALGFTLLGEAMREALDPKLRK